MNKLNLEDGEVEDNLENSLRKKISIDPFTVSDEMELIQEVSGNENSPDFENAKETELYCNKNPVKTSCCPSKAKESGVISSANPPNKEVITD